MTRQIIGEIPIGAAIASSLPGQSGAGSLGTIFRQSLAVTGPMIFMDGCSYPADPDPTWYGHSTGHWEGETLVVDTVGFNDKFWFDNLGLAHTEKLYTIERYTRRILENIRIEVTIAASFDGWP